MASKVMLTGQVKRARGGTTWLLMEEKANGALAASYDSQNENLSPNVPQGPDQWEDSFSKLQIRESSSTSVLQSQKATNRRDGQTARGEEEARLRRIGEQYCLPTKELLAAGSQDEDSLRAILQRQKELLSEFQSHPLGALYPPSLPVGRKDGQGHDFIQAHDSEANAFEVAHKVQRMESTNILTPLCNNTEIQIPEQRHLQANRQNSQSAEDLEEAAVETTKGTRTPLFVTRKLENESMQPLLNSRTVCCSPVKAATPPSTRLRIVSAKGEEYKANDQGYRSSSRPWVSSYKPATQGAKLTKPTKLGSRKPRIPASSTQDKNEAEPKDRLDDGKPRRSRLVRHASSGASQSTEPMQEKHVMVFASQSKEWEEEMTTMAAEPQVQQYIWKDASTAGSFSRSATASEPENGIGRYNMKNLTDLQKEILTLGGDGGHPVVPNDEMPSRKEFLTRSSRKSRRLSQVLRSEDDLSRQSKHYLVEMQHLQEQLDVKDYEVESLRTAGMFLKNLYNKQSEELKILKASYPVTFKETAQLRELCRKQGDELHLTRAAVPALKSQVFSLTSQVVTLKQDLAKVKAERDSIEQKLHQIEPAAQNRRLQCKSINHCDGQHKTQEPVRPTHGTNFLKHYYVNPNKDGVVHGVVPYEENECKQVPHTGSSVQKAHGDQGFRRIGDKHFTDKDLEDMLFKLHSYADREQAVLQERCANALRELRRSSHTDENVLSSNLWSKTEYGRH